MMEQPKKINKVDINVERREKPIDALLLLTRQISKKINEDIKEKYNTKCDLVTEQGMISMDFFSRENGGIYTKEEIEKDNKEILTKEIEWSGAYHPNIQDFYKKTKGIEGEEAIAKAWIKGRERDKSSQVEMLANAVFYKVLKNDFFVSRASRKDDLGGIDTYLVNKKTGDIICAFDEVHDHALGDRKDEKWKRVESIGKGGKTIKYGVVPDGDKLIQKEIRNVPVFFLSLTTEELIRGMDGFSRNIDDSPNEWERKTFNKFTALLQEEYDRIKDVQMPSATRDNLIKFKRVLETMKEIADKYTK